MKKLVFLLPVLFLLAACGETPQYEMTAENTSSVDLQDVPVVVPRAEAEAQLGEAASGDLVLMNNGQIMPAQFEDLDGDGQWDELIALVDIPAGQSASLVLQPAGETSASEPAQRTNIRMAAKTETEDEFELLDSAERLQGTDTRVTSQYFQYEGPGWENDKIAFRNYFDERNGMDIFGKTTTDMILQKIGVGASYHELQDWGMDILKVGNSLGSGAIALLYQDSLYRVTAPEGATYQLVAEGPLRSTFDLDFAEVQVGDRTVGVKHRISITAGVYGYQSEVFISGESEGMQIVSGIVNMQSEEAHLLEEGGMNILYTYDNQSFDNEKLGMALMASDEYYQSWRQTPDEGEGIVQTYGMVMQPDADGKAVFHFLAGWELSDERFKSEEGFVSYLKEEAARQSL